MKYHRKKRIAPRNKLTSRQIELAQAIFDYLSRENPQTKPFHLIEETIRQNEISDAKTINHFHFHVWKILNDRFQSQLILTKIDKFPDEFIPAFYWWLYLRFNWQKNFRETSALYDTIQSRPAAWRDIKTFFRKLETAYGNYLNFLKKQDTLIRECWQKSCRTWLIVLARQLFKRGEREAFLLPDFFGTIFLRTNTLKTDTENLLKTLKKEGVEAGLSRRVPGCIWLEPACQLTGLKSYENGLFDFQDEITQLFPLLCKIQPGWQVWDVWDNDGANALALATLMKNQGKLLVSNLKKNLSKDFSEKTEQNGIEILQVRVPKNIPKHDLVWLAAPNSETGAIRTNPVIKAQLTENRFNKLCGQQQKLIVQAAAGVKPGGFLAYTTQSVLPQENDQLIEWFLKTHPNFKPQKISHPLLENYPNKCWTPFGFTTFPLMRKTNAHYLSLLKLDEKIQE